MTYEMSAVIAGIVMGLLYWTMCGWRVALKGAVVVMVGAYLGMMLVG